jgi:hypothetical protein
MPENSPATDQLAGCNKHTLYNTMRIFLRKSYEAGAELLPRTSRDFLSVHLAGIEKNDSCLIRHRYNYFHLTDVLHSKLKHRNLMLPTKTILGLIYQISSKFTLLFV